MGLEEGGVGLVRGEGPLFICQGCNVIADLSLANPKADT